MSWIDDVAIIITVHERPELCRSLIASIHRFYPSVHIYVCDDSLERTQYEPASEDGTVTNVHPRAYDIGVSAKRNRLVEAASEPYLMLCEDDFEFTVHSDLKLFYDTIQALPKVGLVGAACCRGREGSRWPKKGVKRTYFTMLSKLVGPVQEMSRLEKPGRVTHNGRTIRYHRTHTVCNWFLARRETLLAAPWDEDLKISGEHQEHMTRMQAVCELTEDTRRDNAGQYLRLLRGERPDGDDKTTIIYARAGFANQKHFPNRRRHFVREGERVRVPTEYAKQLMDRGLAYAALNHNDAATMPVEAATSEDGDDVPMRQVFIPDTTCAHNRQRSTQYRKMRHRSHQQLQKDKMGIFARRWTKGQWSTYPHGEPNWDDPSSHAHSK